MGAAIYDDLNEQGRIDTVPPPPGQADAYSAPTCVKRLPVAELYREAAFAEATRGQIVDAEDAGFVLVETTKVMHQAPRSTTPSASYVRPIIHAPRPRPAPPTDRFSRVWTTLFVTAGLALFGASLYALYSALEG